VAAHLFGAALVALALTGLALFSAPLITHRIGDHWPDDEHQPPHIRIGDHNQAKDQQQDGGFAANTNVHVRSSSRDLPPRRSRSSKLSGSPRWADRRATRSSSVGVTVNVSMPSKRPSTNVCKSHRPSLSGVSDPASGRCWSGCSVLSPSCK